jgi:thiosulfate/3-mercaptopyruvate sulfurtransferase
MSLRRLLKIVAIFAGMLPAVLVEGAGAQFSDPAAAPLSAMTVPKTQLMEPGELVPMLKEGGGRQPVMLQVGSRVMFAQAHIPGSLYAGPGSQMSGLQLLEQAVAKTPKGKLVVIYCGCCPWNRCPNIGPAYKRLRDLGFTNVKALYLANNFGDDWMGKGYPTARGE